MPSLRRTPFNQGGSYVPDAFDEIETGNRNAALQNAQFGYGAQQNDRMTQLALAKLGQENYQFGQGRADNMAMFREKLAADTHGQDLQAGLTREGWGHEDARYGQQFKYMTGRDTMLDKRYGEEQAFLHDPNNPTNMAAHTSAVAMQKLADEQERQRLRLEARDKITDTAGNEAPDMTGWTPDDIAAYKARIGAGAAPSSAGYGVGQQRKERDAGEIGIEEDALGGDLAKFSEKDNAVTGWDPTSEQGQALAARLAKLEEHLRVKLNLGQTAAHERANNLIRNRTKTSLNSGNVDALLKLRGLE